MDDLFDALESERAKQEGMRVAADNRLDVLALARSIASDLGAQHGEVHADMVGRVLKDSYGIETLGPAAGSLFKTDQWEFTGRFKKSARVTNHSRLLRVWRFKQDAAR